MTKQKKSFLDKIISSDFKEENVVKTIDENKISEKVVNFEKVEEDIIDDNSENVVEEKVVEKKSIQIEEEDKEIKNDIDDEEGQLTVDVYKTDNIIVIKSIIGGVRPEDLDVSVTSDMVTIKGKRSNPDNVMTDDYYYQECFWGDFSRSIILPNDIKTEDVEATIKNGVLTVRLPKIEKNSSMKIKVKSE